MVFENGVKNVQAAAYNGALTVYLLVYRTRTSLDLKPLSFISRVFLV